VLLLSAGIQKDGPKTIAEADPVNYAPFIKGPKLMIHGRYDEGIQFKTGAEPLFRLFCEPKELVVLETGHFPPMDQWVPVAKKWLDKVLGPIETR
jgi:pimeloyl-ACP methyl ester carboxylesterase